MVIVSDPDTIQTQRLWCHPLAHGGAMVWRISKKYSSI